MRRRSRNFGPVNGARHIRGWFAVIREQRSLRLTALSQREYPKIIKMCQLLREVLAARCAQGETVG